MINSICRYVLAGAAAFMTTLLLLKASVALASPAGDRVRPLADIYARANAALMRGDAKTWTRLVPMTRDFVLFSPFGGKPSRYADYTPERIERMGRFFRNGSHRQELVQAFVGQDMVVLATIERDDVEVGGLPRQEWALRVTSVFKREGSQWKLAHRHADPFVEDVAIAESARIARGERALAVE